MSENRKYTVIELGEVLNVPRTTVTDWLTRYAQYIDFKVQGKRRVYTEKSVEVLKEISELRNKGLSSFDIEEELAKNHPVHVEVSQEKEEENSDADQNSSSQDSSQLVLRKSMNEMGEMLKSTLMEMNRRIEEIDRMNRENAARANRWTIIAVTLIAVMFFAGTVAYFKLELSYSENRKLQLDNQTYLKDVKITKESLNSSQITLNEREKQISELEAGMEKQVKEFQDMLSKTKQDTESAKNAEILELKDKFAEDRLKVLKDLDDSKNDKEKMNMFITKMQTQLYDQNEIIKSLSDKISTPAEAPAVPSKEAKQP